MRKILYTAVIVLLTCHVCLAEIPQTMSYQGILKKADGTLVDDGSYSLTFKLYDVSSGGSSLWTETQSVSVSGGIVNVILGSKTSIDLPFDKQYWLGINVGSASELTPRIKLASSPYSLNSKGGLTLPYSEVITTIEPVFYILNQGSGNTISGVNTGTGSAITGYTTGTSYAGFFSINNANSGSPAIAAGTNGSGPSGFFYGSGNSSEGIWVSVPTGNTGLYVSGGTKNAVVATSLRCTQTLY